MPQFVGNGHRQEGGRGIHIEVGFSQKGKVNSRKAHAAHDAAKGHGFGHAVFIGKAGKLLRNVIIDRNTLLENLVLILCKKAVFIPGHQIRRFRKTLGKNRAQRLQFLHRHHAGCKAAAVLKGIGIVIHAPEEAEKGVNRKAERNKSHEKAVCRAAFSLFAHSHHKANKCCRNRHHHNGDDKFHHGKGHRVAHLTDGIFYRPCHLLGKKIHPAAVSLCQVKKKDDGKRRHQGNMHFFMAFEKHHPIPGIFSSL